MRPQSLLLARPSITVASLFDARLTARGSRLCGCSLWLMALPLWFTRCGSLIMVRGFRDVVLGSCHSVVECGSESIVHCSWLLTRGFRDVVCGSRPWTLD